MPPCEQADKPSDVVSVTRRVNPTYILGLTLTLTLQAHIAWQPRRRPARAAPVAAVSDARHRSAGAATAPRPVTSL